MDGTHGEMAEEVERFAQRVRKQIGVAGGNGGRAADELWKRNGCWKRFREDLRDEKLTSSRKRRKHRRKDVDAVAAAVIFEGVLERRG